MIKIHLAEDLDSDDVPEVLRAIEELMGCLGVMVSRVEMTDK